MPEPIMIGGYTLTQVFIVAIVVICSLFDLWMYTCYGRIQSISCTFITACRNHPDIAFISGLVIGHVFLGVRNF